MKKKLIYVFSLILLMSLIVGCGSEKEEKKTDNKAIVLDEDTKNEKIEDDDTEENDEKIDEKLEEDSEGIEESEESEESEEDSDSLESSEESDDEKENSNKRIGDASSEKKEKANALSPFEEHGKLGLSGTKILDKNGNPFQIKGVSTHGLSWFPEYVNKDAFKTMRDSWGVNLVRLAMYTGEGGYCSGASQKDLKKLIDDGVSYATDLGMYVIIDWHILSDNDPNTNKDEAAKFFDEMSLKYASSDNVIYEICNEPNGGTSWSDIKKYALEIIPIIKKNSPDAIIVVGTPTWSQDVDQAALDPIDGYTNIMYTLHFYADTHREQLRDKMTNALKSGLPIFVTEFGICDASGNGAVNIDEANKWIDLMEKNGVGYCIWNLSNKAESSALINSDCSKKSDWTIDELSDEGKWYVDVLGGNVQENNSDKESATTSTDSKSKDSDKSDTGSSKSGTKKSNAKTFENNGKKMTIEQTGSWNDGKKDYCQYTINVYAKEVDISDWKINIDLDENVAIDQSWSADYEMSGKKSIVIKPVDFNKNIKKGEKAEFGFILAYDGTVTITSASIE